MPQDMQHSTAFRESVRAFPAHKIKSRNANPLGSNSQSSNAAVTEDAALPSIAVERWLLYSLLRILKQPPLQFRLWDGVRIEPEGTYPKFSMFIADRKAIYQLLANPSVAFGDLYSEGRLQVEGSLVELLEVLYYAMFELKERGPALLRKAWRDHAPRPGGLDEAPQNIHHHYDLGNDFYRLWLDEVAMQYTCAYYDAPDQTLEEAQIAKMDLVCRKLMLKPGMRVVEAGSGWGGLACHMAERFGVEVVSYNISQEQIAYSRRNAKKRGLASRVTFVEDDYRNIRGKFDCFASVGMLEHVGKENYPALARVIDRVLEPTGVGLIHTIGRNKPSNMNSWIEKRIFPGAYPPSVGELMALFEAESLSVLDVENLRLHYAKTLEHWLERYEQKSVRVEAMYDGEFVRAWRLYLAGSIAAFRVGSLQLFQVVFSKGANNCVPRNRRHLYEPSAEPCRFNGGEG